MTKAAKEMPLFIRVYEFLAWLVPLTERFPRLHRHTVTRRLLEASLDFQENLLEANEVRGMLRLNKLLAADASLSKVRVYLRLANRLQWISLKQYEHAGRLLAELGRLLGGWQKITREAAQKADQGS